MLNVNPDKFYKELIENKDSFHVLNYTKGLSKKNLIVFDENERTKDWIEKLDNAEYVLMKTDHSFSDKRLELIEKVSEWINN